MSLLDLAGPYKLWIYAGAAVLVVGVIGGGYVHIQSLKEDLATEQAARANDKAAAERLARQAEAEYRAKEQSWAAKQQEIVDEALKKVEASAAAASAADAASGRLRDRVAAVAAAGRRSTCDSTLASRGAATSDPIGVLADVLGRADAAAGLMASVADQRGIRGEACERAYEALRDKPAPKP